MPRYFTLDDRSGYESLAVSEDEAQDEAAHQDTLPSGWPRLADVRTRVPNGREGQVVRMVNTGIAVHQMHFHGNHIWTHRRENQDLSRSVPQFVDGHVRLQQWGDVVELDPLQSADVLLPLKRPPDVVPAVWAARTEDWTYPMHCHAEMSQTAGGGVYPGGIVDRRWHELNHAAGLSGQDVGLNRFEPRHFYLLGGTLGPVPTRRRRLGRHRPDGGGRQPDAPAAAHVAAHPQRRVPPHPADLPRPRRQARGDRSGHRARRPAVPRHVLADRHQRTAADHVVDDGVRGGGALRAPARPADPRAVLHAGRVDHWVRNVVIGSRTIPNTVT